MRNAKQNGLAAVGQSMVARCAVLVLNAITGIVTARALSVSDRGHLSAMILWPLLLANAFTLGLPSALTFNINKKRESESQLVGAALLISLISGAMAALCAGLALPRALQNYSVDTVWCARLFLINTPVGLVLQISRAVFEAKNDFRLSSRSQWLMPLANLMGLVILLALGRFTPVSAGFAYVFCATPFAVWIFRELWISCRPTLQSFQMSVKTLLSYGLRSYGVDLCGTLSMYVDQAMVVGLLDAKAMGTYAVALSLSRMLNMCHNSVIVVLFPRSVGRSTVEVLRVTASAARVSTLLTSCGAMALLVSGPKILNALYGHAYVGATTILRLLVIEMVLGGLVSVLSQAPMALGRPGLVTLLQSLGLGLTLPLLFVLVPRYGLMGAGLAILSSTVCRFVFIMASFPVILGVPMPRLLVTSADVQPFQRLGSAVLRRARAITNSAGEIQMGGA